MSISEMRGPAAETRLRERLYATNGWGASLLSQARQDEREGAWFDPETRLRGRLYANRVVTTGCHSRRGERQARQRARRERRAAGACVKPQAVQDGWRRGTARRGPWPQLRGRAPISTARRRQRRPWPAFEPCLSSATAWAYSWRRVSMACSSLLM